MSLPDGFRDRWPDAITQLLKDAWVAQCSVYVERLGRFRFFRTFYESGTQENLDADGNGEDTIIYAIGSLTKLLIALLMSIIIDKLSLSGDPKDERYHLIRTIEDRDPWDIPFVTLFNHFSDIKMLDLPKSPTLRHILLHFNSLPPMNAILLGPEGTSILSEREFLEVAPRLAQAKYGNKTEDYVAYSNGNYILVGLLIKAIAKDSISNLMTAHIFEPLGMMHTYMSVPESPIPVAKPYVVCTLEGKRRLSNFTPYGIASIVIPAMGACSNSRDVAILLRTIQKCISGEDTIFEQRFVNHFLKPEARLGKNESSVYTTCGIYTTLDTSTPGSKSINRFITPTNVCSTYHLGLSPKGQQINTYYLTGAINGYASCLYFIPKWQTFVIVLSNTSGRIDASDHISRLMLQEIFQLERTRGHPARLNIPRIGLALGLSNFKLKVDILNMSSRAKHEGQKLIERWAFEDTQNDISTSLSIQLHGTYFNRLMGQSIVIVKEGNRFLAKVKGQEHSSRDIGIIRTGRKTIRFCPLKEVGFSIDRYDPDGWKELSFKLSIRKADEFGHQRVVGLKRRGAPIYELFEWQEE